MTVRSLEAPTAVGSLDDLELVLGQPPHNVEVADAFAGELLTYAAESVQPGPGDRSGLGDGGDGDARWRWARPR